MSYKFEIGVPAPTPRKTYNYPFSQLAAVSYDAKGEAQYATVVLLPEEGETAAKLLTRVRSALNAKKYRNEGKKFTSRLVKKYQARPGTKAVEAVRVWRLDDEEVEVEEVEEVDGVEVEEVEESEGEFEFPAE